MISRRKFVGCSLGAFGASLLSHHAAQAYDPERRWSDSIEGFWRHGQKHESLKPFAVKGDPPQFLLIEIMAGDNNLSAFIYEDLKEMAAGMKGGSIGVIALADLTQEPAAVVEVSNSHGIQLIEDWGEIDTGEPEPLASFISRALITFPAARKMIGFWGHSTGVFDEVDANEKLLKVSMLHDDTDGGVLTNREVGRMLAAAFARAGQTERVELMFSDGGLNGMVEVMEELSPFTRCFVDSQDLTPGDGLDFEQWFSDIVAQPPKTAEDLARIAVDAYCIAYEPYPKRHPATLAGYRTSNSIVSAFKRLVAAVRAEGDFSSFVYLDQVRRQAQSFAHRDTYDLRDFGEKLASTAGQAKPLLARAARDVVAACDAARIQNCALGTTVTNAQGLAFWFPASRSVLQRDVRTYSELSFARQTGWSDLLIDMR